MKYWLKSWRMLVVALAFFVSGSAWAAQCSVNVGGVQSMHGYKYYLLKDAGATARTSVTSALAGNTLSLTTLADATGGPGTLSYSAGMSFLGIPAMCYGYVDNVTLEAGSSYYVLVLSASFNSDATEPQTTVYYLSTSKTATSGMTTITFDVMSGTTFTQGAQSTTIQPNTAGVSIPEPIFLRDFSGNLDGSVGSWSMTDQGTSAYVSVGENNQAVNTGSFTPYGTMPETLFNNGTFTIAARMTLGDTVNGTTFSFGEKYGKNVIMTRDGSDLRAKFIVDDGTVLYGPALPSEATYATYVISRTGAELILYVNGERCGSVPHTASSATSYTKVKLGGLMGGIVNSMQEKGGYLDSLAIYDAAFSGEQALLLAIQNGDAVAYDYTATVSADTQWSDIEWTVAGATTMELPSNAKAELTVVGTPTITFDPSMPVTLSHLKVKGTPTFFVADYTPPEAKFFSTPILMATVVWNDVIEVQVGDIAGVQLDPDIGTTGVYVNGCSFDDDTRVISLNITGGHNDAPSGANVEAECLAGLVPTDAAFWNNMAQNKTGTFTESKTVFTEAYANSTLASDFCALHATVSAANTFMTRRKTRLDGNADLAFGYLDDGGSGAQIALSNIPYTDYTLVVYLSADSDGSFGAVSLNGISYAYVQGELTAGTTAAWGSRATALASSVTWLPGTNCMVFEGRTDASLTIQGAVGVANGPRTGIAGIQLICTGVSLARDYTAAVAENYWLDLNWEPSQFEDGTLNTATLTFDGSVSDFDFNAEVTAAKISFAGEGDMTFTNAEGHRLSGIAAFDFSGMTEEIFVQFSTGASSVSAGSTTHFAVAGSGALTIGAGKKAIFDGFDAWTGAIQGPGTLEISNAADLTRLLGGRTVIYSGATSAVALSDVTVFNTGNLTFTDGARLSSTQATTVLDPENPDAADAKPGFRFRPSANVTFSKGATFDMPNGYLELYADNSYGNTGTGAFTLTGAGTRVSIRGIGGGNIYLGDSVPVKIEDGAVLEIGNMGLHYAQANNCYTLAMNKGTLRATSSFDVEERVRMTLAENSLNTFDAGANVLSYTSSISGAGALQTMSSGAGMVVLAGSNNYTGSTTVKTGTLKLGENGSIGTGGLILSPNTTFDISDITVTLSMSVTIEAGTQATLNVGGRTLTDGQMLITWDSAPAGDFTVATARPTIFSFVKTAQGLKVTSAPPEVPTVTPDAGESLSNAEIAAVQAAALNATPSITSGAITVSKDAADKILLLNVTPTFVPGANNTYTVAPIAVAFDTQITFNPTTVTTTIKDGSGTPITIKSDAAQVVIRGANALTGAWTPIGSPMTGTESTFSTTETSTYKFFKFAVESK